MSIEIKIVDPSADQLRALLEIFYPVAVMPAHPRVIADADRPDAGAPNGVDAAAAFTPSTPPPEAVFAQGTPEAAFAAAVTGPNAGPAPTIPGALIAPAPVGSSPVPPPAPGASVPPAPGGVELDSRGLPWDARIHAKSSTGPGGTKNADGTWRSKRGINDAALVARIENELRQVLAAPGPVPTPPAAGNVPTPPATSAPAAPVPSAGATVPPAPPVGGATPPATPPAPTGNYVELVQQIAAAMGAGKLTQQEVEAACAEFGIPGLPLLATRLDLVPSVSSRINQLLSMRP